MAVPVTSISLLKVLGKDAQSPRWTEFAKKYASTIDGYLLKEFPDVDKDEVVNDTLIVLTKKLPLYEYDPDTKGHFSNFLIGIVKNKAREWLKKFRRDEERRAALEEKAQYEWEYEKQSYRVDLRDWRKEAYEATLTQFMASPPPVEEPPCTSNPNSKSLRTSARIFGILFTSCESCGGH